MSVKSTIAMKAWI